MLGRGGDEHSNSGTMCNVVVYLSNTGFGCDVNGGGNRTQDFGCRGQCGFSFFELIFIDSCKLGRVGNDR